VHLSHVLGISHPNSPQVIERRNCPPATTGKVLGTTPLSSFSPISPIVRGSLHRQIISNVVFFEAHERDICTNDTLSSLLHVRAFLKTSTNPGFPSQAGLPTSATSFSTHATSYPIYKPDNLASETLYGNLSTFSFIHLQGSTFPCTTTFRYTGSPNPTLTTYQYPAT
jgi:hypothetical protein